MRDKFLTLCAYFIWIASACVAFSYLLNANVSFWYDPARDLLSAWDSLHKVTLIGQPSGIPGFFYGPYWIWWLRVGLIFSKNPVVVTAITITIPYLLGFAGILWLLSKLFGKSVSILLWVLYFISFQGVMTQLWNPYVAPLFYLGVIYILIYWKNKIKNIQSSLPICFAGILTGLALNTHISFSVGFGLGCILFLILEKIFIFSKEKMDERIRQLFFSLCSFCMGIGLTFIPFFLFEIRHGFNQTRIAFNAFLHGGNVVLQHGLSKQDIIISFFGKFSELTKIPFFPAMLVLSAIGLTLMLYLYRKKLSTQEVRLLLLLTIIAISVLLLYLVAKNPIWPYHFIGMDVIWLLLLAFLQKSFQLYGGFFLFGLYVLACGQVGYL